MVLTSRFRRPRKASRSIADISVNCSIWRIWAWPSSSRPRETLFAPPPPLETLTNQLGPKLQEHRLQVIHRRPGADADSDVLLQSRQRRGMDANASVGEPIDEA